MNYCWCCGRWRRIIAYLRCQECFDTWLNGRGDECQHHQ